MKYGGYGENEIGVEMLVDSYLSDRHLFVRHRTLADSDEEEVAELSNFRLLSPAARDRYQFEFTVNLLLWGAEEVRPAEVEEAERLLGSAFIDSVKVCVDDSEWPDAILYEDASSALAIGNYEQYEASAEVQQLSWDDYVDLRHECSKFAASYPVLDRSHRDELLAVQRNHYLEVLRLWMRDNPDLVVPLDYERSANQPYQDYVREVCQAADDPQECILEEGVGLP